MGFKRSTHIALKIAMNIILSGINNANVYIKDVCTLSDELTKSHQAVW